MSRIKKLHVGGLFCLSSLVLGCTNTVEWQEEVKLSDGRVIVVHQKRRCEGGNYKAESDASCVAREAWLTANLPDIFAGEITWHDTLKPMILNVHLGQLYIVGRPPTSLEFRAHGAANPPYFGFRWKDDSWIAVPFAEIPIAIYDSNMLIESIPRNKTAFLSVAAKDSTQENGNPVYPEYLRRIDPKHTTPTY